MPNPGIKRSHRFQNDGFGSFSVAISSLPRTWTIFPSPVHAVDASNHAREAWHLTLPQKPSHVPWRGCSEVLIGVEGFNCRAKPHQGLYNSCFFHPRNLIHLICRCFICKHSQGNRNFLAWEEDLEHEKHPLFAQNMDHGCKQNS